MKNMSRFSKILACAAAVVLAASCGRTAKITAVVADAPSSDVVVKLLNINTFQVLDTVKLDETGKFTYKVSMKFALATNSALVTKHAHIGTTEVWNKNRYIYMPTHTCQYQRAKEPLLPHSSLPFAL